MFIKLLCFIVSMVSANFTYNSYEIDNSDLELSIFNVYFDYNYVYDTDIDCNLHMYFDENDDDIKLLMEYTNHSECFDRFTSIIHIEPICIGNSC